MVFATAKLKLAHLFVSSKRLSKHMLKNERAATIILEQLEKDYYSSLREALQYGSNPQALWLAEQFCKQALEFSSKAVFSEEQESLLYIMRKYGTFEDLAKDFNKDTKNYLQKSEVSEQTQQKMQAVLKNLAGEEQKIHGIIRTIFKEIRHEKRDKERFKEKIFNLRQEANLRKDLKEMRQKSTAEHQFSEKGEHLLDDLEKELKHLKGDEKAADIEAKIGKTLDEFERVVVKDEELLNEVINDAAYVIKYALHEFFHCEELVETYEHYYWQLYTQGFLAEETAARAKQLFKELHNRLDQKTKETYRIIRKYRKRAGKEEVDAP
ncbi:hypothetical protein JXA12_04170 [Candidatus Woesearchaeota archaeon]|nr:hypothetical protein [Candidatus Woesearchaeota archaeon]